MTAPLTPSRVLVTGATRWSDRAMIEELLDEYAQRKLSVGGSFRVITGMADGADEIARRWAEDNGVPVLAESLEPGRYPGPMHDYNDKMLGWFPELVLAFKDPFAEDWKDDARVAGTEHMARIAVRQGIPVLLNGREWLASRRLSAGYRATTRSTSTRAPTARPVTPMQVREGSSPAVK